MNRFHLEETFPNPATYVIDITSAVPVQIRSANKSAVIPWRHLGFRPYSPSQLICNRRLQSFAIAAVSAYLRPFAFCRVLADAFEMSSGSYPCRFLSFVCCCLTSYGTVCDRQDQLPKACPHLQVLRLTCESKPHLGLRFCHDWRAAFFTF